MPETLTESQKEALREMVGRKCENCKKHEDQIGKLHAHRILRGYKGGLYVPHNIKMVCRKCHKAIHYGEFK